MLRCMALVQPRWFPMAYADWEGLVDKAAAALREAGYSAETVASIVDPARSGRLLTAVTDRQADIADCAGETAWMTRYATFAWYSLAGEVDDSACGQPLNAAALEPQNLSSLLRANQPPGAPA